ncbi:DnaD domain protein [Bacillus sp. JJ1521]|uniref:DnaD domain-containing protein n=1 Tax=Bacillus sp. JJ1521 TaxID=3122957 RepID=UPI002FFFD6A8
MYGNILLDESPLIIAPTLAKMVGLNECIILQQVHYWLKRSSHIKLNQKWVYFTYDQLMEQIPFLSKSTIQRTVLKLERNGYLSSNNFNKLKIDKTKWYTINYENLDELKKEGMTDDHTIVEDKLSPSYHSEQVECSEQTDHMPEVNCPSIQVNQSSESTWHAEEFNLNTPIPETTTEITSKISSETSSSSKDLQQEEVKEDPFRFFEQNGFGTIGSFLADKIQAWCTDLSDQLVIEVMKLAIVNSSKRWNYVEAILRDWVDKGYQTVDDVQAARLAFKNQMNHQSRKKPTRKELLPDWFHKRNQDYKAKNGTTFEEDKKSIEEQLNKLKETPDPQQGPVHNPSFEEKKRLFEERKKRMKGQK